MLGDLLAAEIHHLHEKRFYILPPAVSDQNSDIRGQTGVSMLFESILLHIVVVAFDVFEGVSCESFFHQVDVAGLFHLFSS